MQRPEFQPFHKTVTTKADGSKPDLLVIHDYMKVIGTTFTMSVNQAKIRAAATAVSDLPITRTGMFRDLHEFLDTIDLIAIYARMCAISPYRELALEYDKGAQMHKAGARGSASAGGAACEDDGSNRSTQPAGFSPFSRAVSLSRADVRLSPALFAATTTRICAQNPPLEIQRLFRWPRRWWCV